MQERDSGYFDLQLKGTEPGSLYCFRLNGERERPDPASRFQPLGVHGPSQVIEQQFGWEDENWKGIPLSDAIFYEFACRNFYARGDIRRRHSRLKELEDLGVTTLKISAGRPVPGERTLGVRRRPAFRRSNSYGGPEGFKRFVNAAIGKRIGGGPSTSVTNHLGPERKLPS
jgi:maltooligosyltrehalose trehalohydrolase